MGAIEQDGYIFKIEYSIVQQKGAIHVYREGMFIDELLFSFTGTKPDEHQIEALIDEYVEKKR
jgi:hypothetical protein